MSWASYNTTRENGDNARFVDKVVKRKIRADDMTNKRNPLNNGGYRVFGDNKVDRPYNPVNYTCSYETMTRLKELG